MFFLKFIVYQTELDPTTNERPEKNGLYVLNILKQAHLTGKAP